MTKKMRNRSLNAQKVAHLVKWGSEQCHKISDSPQLDAELLLTHAINKPRSFCRTWPDKELNVDQVLAFKELIQLRLKPTPIAYILGYKEFWSRDFIVNESTLIPRPETELLIEKALDFLNTKSKPQSILDLGTGTGCIAITLKLEEERHNIVAVDYSSEALNIAKKNAHNLRADVSFIESNWFQNIPIQQFDLIVSNPPYIPKHDKHLSQGDLPAEPISALASGEDGLDDIQLISSNSWQYLNTGGMVLIEHGYDQKESVSNILIDNGFESIKQFNDLAGQARLTSGIKP